MDDVYRYRSQVYAVDQKEDLDEAVCVQRKDNHKVQETLGLLASTTLTFHAVLDTIMASNLVHHRSFLWAANE